MKHLIIILSSVILFAACQEKGHRTTQKTDTNGYSYEEVTNDAFNARIYTLKNGLKVYLAKNADEPRIQTIIAVRAGAKDDPRDNTGLAHYLEHMMFKGSNHFGTSDWEKEQPLLDSITNLFEAHKAASTAEEKKAIYQRIDATSQEASHYAISNEYDKIVGAIGASGTNAFTSSDLTAYVNDIPANEIEKFLKLELDRFSNIQLRLFHTELETVYEEFNMYQDMGSQMIWNRIFEGLFASHPYRVDVIGLPEHLKSPSMKSVMAFQKKYYVPNNMAVILSGDLQFEPTVQLVDKYFGQMKPNDNLKKTEKVKEEPITKTQTFEVFTPDREQIAVAYRTEGAGSKDALYLDIIGSILYNGKAGLIDLDVIQKQKALNLFAGTNILKDYGMFVFMGSPRQGQTLEDIGVIVQEEIDKLKAGDFDERLLEAIINNEKLALIQATDNRSSACNRFLDAFINEEPWQESVEKISKISKITKSEIIAFANEFFLDNYVTVYKRTGENRNKVVVDKPTITPITINRDAESAFAAEISAMETKPVEPVFLDYKTLVKKETLKDGIDFYYTKNQSNNIYSLSRFVEIGSKTDKRLALAFNYLPYLGTSRLTPEELRKEMYLLAMDFNAHSTQGRSYLNLSGLDETFQRSFVLMNEMINDAKPNEEAYRNLVDDILKKRANAKLNKSQILRGGLLNYAKYGPKSSFTDILSEEELKAIKPQELIDIIKQFSGYKHGYFYYGPDSEAKIAKILKDIKTPETLADTPPRIEYPELPMDKPTVYFADYDMVQTEIILLAKNEVFNPALLPAQNMFNSYYGGKMNAVVFQEIREARGLAYSAYAHIQQPSRAGQSNYLIAYVGTQADKMATALDAFEELLGEMKRSDKSFALCKEYVINNIRSERITKADIFWNYMSLKDLGLDYDIRKPVFESIQTMTLDDLQRYFDEHVKNAKYSILLVGKRDKVNFDYFKKYAEVKETSLEELFGY
ncbi:MAG: insulinase family protein [Dysgonamonadaceae bacterium]|jgi:predicted Zn-dependent peptidase|nr:insulinase family protein [Dysgonamonadaceae bacterium]